MNLLPISGNASHAPLRLPAACTQCGGDVSTDTGYADLDGEPFKAYVCAACVAPLLARQPIKED